MKLKKVHYEIFIFDKSKIFKTMTIHFKLNLYNKWNTEYRAQVVFHVKFIKRAFGQFNMINEFNIIMITKVFTCMNMLLLSQMK